MAISQPDVTKQRKINVAIDGPAGAGKSTVARLVALALEYVYVDTGAMYRAVTLHMIRHGVRPEETELVARKAAELDIRLVPERNRQKVLLDGEDVTELIRSLEVNRQVSHFAKIERLRQMLVDMQRRLAAGKGVVMDGRDIGTQVLPDAEAKFFLTASVEERALRRYKEMEDCDHVSLEQLQREIAERDRLDEQRTVSPLVCASDAIRLDTTSMSIDDVVAHIVSYCRTKTDGAK